VSRILALDYVSTFSKIEVRRSTPSVSEVVVVPFRSLRDTARARLAEHFELVLTTAGVMLAVMLTFSQLDRGTQGLAFTFLVWLQGFLIWAVRRHSRLARLRLIRKLRVMLQDRVNNQLTVLVGVAELRGTRGRTPVPEDVETAMTAALAVSHELESLSMESLRHWESRYARHLPTPIR
jgi:hypothetical protein